MEINQEEKLGLDSMVKLNEAIDSKISTEKSNQNKNKIPTSSDQIKP